MLSTEEFKAFSNEYVMFAHVTTRIEGRKNDGLLSEKGGRGFPHLVALDADGDVISKLSGGRDVEGFREMMAQGAEFVRIRSKPEKTLDDQVFLLGHDIDMGTLDLEQARERVAALPELGAAQKSKIDGMMLGLEITDALPKGRDPEAARAAGKKFAEWWAAGREPTSDQHIQPFFILMLEHAESVKDADLFSRALGKLRDKFGDNPRAAGFFKKQDERLEALRSAGEDHDEADDGAGDDDGM